MPSLPATTAHSWWATASPRRRRRLLPAGQTEPLATANRDPTDRSCPQGSPSRRPTSSPNRGLPPPVRPVCPGPGHAATATPPTYATTAGSNEPADPRTDASKLACRRSWRVCHTPPAGESARPADLRRSSLLPARERCIVRRASPRLTPRPGPPRYRYLALQYPLRTSATSLTPPVPGLRSSTASSSSTATERSSAGRLGKGREPTMSSPRLATISAPYSPRIATTLGSTRSATDRTAAIPVAPTLPVTPATPATPDPSRLSRFQPVLATCVSSNTLLSD